MLFIKKKLVLILTFLFILGLAADPVLHSSEADIHEIIECQVCESEQSKAYDNYFLQSYALKSSTLSSQENVIYSFFSKGFSARAPPNS